MKLSAHMSTTSLSFRTASLRSPQSAKDVSLECVTFLTYKRKKIDISKLCGVCRELGSTKSSVLLCKCNCQWKEDLVCYSNHARFHRIHQIKFHHG